MVSGNGYEDLSAGVVDRGAFYLFEWANSQWSFRKKIVAPTPVNLDLFGHAVGIHGDYIFVSARSASNARGKVYFYALN